MTTCGNSLSVEFSSAAESIDRSARWMRLRSAGSGRQNCISVMRYASASRRSAKPNAWNVSTERAWMPSAWPISSLLPRRSMMRVCTSGYIDKLRGEQHAGGAGADDEHVHLIGQVVRPLEPDAGGGEHARIVRDVAVVMELHCFLLRKIPVEP